MVFITKELEPNGNIVNGRYDGNNRKEIIDIITNKGNTPIEITEQISNIDKKNLNINIFEEKVKLKDISLFCRQMGVMLQAGMPIISALDVMSKQSEKAIIRKVSLDVLSNIQTGESLSQSLKKQRKVFPEMLVNMIEAGELTGNIDEVFNDMSEYYSKEAKTMNKVKGAMMYPMVLGITTIVVTIFMLVRVFPTFVTLFESAGADLPALTSMVLTASKIMQSSWYIFVVIFFGVVFSFKKWKSSKSGKKIWDTFILKIPVVNSQLKQIYTARYTRTLSTLISNGINIIEAVMTAGKITQNEFLIEKIEIAVEGLKKGNTLSNEMSKISIFPPMMTSMISIGEESGSLEEMLNKSADFYDEELEAALSKLMGLLEPVMIVFMAVFIGTLVAAMFFPMFDMVSAVG